MAYKQWTEAEKAAYRKGKEAAAGGGGSRGGGRSTRGGSGSQQREPKNYKGNYVAHSGCVKKDNHTTKGGVFKVSIIHGWNTSKTNGKISFVAIPCKDTTCYHKVKDASGNVKMEMRKVGNVTKLRPVQGAVNEKQEKWVATVEFEEGKRTETVTCFWNRLTKKLSFPDLNMVANPYAAHGGYFGRNFKD